MTDHFSRPRTRLLYTGGTIGCAGAPLRPMSGPAFRDACAQAGLLGEANWEWTEPALDSAEIQPADWGALAARVLAGAADGTDDAPVILLHGTDTLAWSAAAFALLTTLIGPDGTPRARRAVPVVLTGSQRPLLAAGSVDPASDAPANLALAEAAARAGGPGVRIAFGGAVLPGARAAKVATLADAAFAAPNGEGALATLPAAPAPALRAQLARLAPHLGRRAVLTVLAAPGDPALAAVALRGAIAALGDRLGALLLLGYGLGTLPGEATLGPILREAKAAGVLLALGTQAPAGPADPARYGAGAWAVEAGALALGDMTRPAAEAKLHVALALAAAHGWDAAAAGRFLLTPIAGEIAPPGMEA